MRKIFPIGHAERSKVGMPQSMPLRIALPSAGQHAPTLTTVPAAARYAVTRCHEVGEPGQT